MNITNGHAMAMEYRQLRTEGAGPVAALNVMVSWREVVLATLDAHPAYAPHTVIVLRRELAEEIAALKATPIHL